MNYYLFLVILIPFSLFQNTTVAQPTDIVGETTEAQIRKEFRIFDLYKVRYKPDSIAVRQLSLIDDSVKIIVVFGTWCKDSKKHIPSLFKILEEADNPKIEVQYIGVNFLNQDPSSAYKRFTLTRNPTIIVFKNKKEIGRIIEKPTVSIEVDLAKTLLLKPKNQK